MRRFRATVAGAVAVLVGVSGCAAARAQTAAPQAAPTRVGAENPASAAGAERAEARDAGETADDVPDLAFLEYLGSWQADDDEWLLIAEWHENEGRDRDEVEGGTRAERRAAAEAEARRARAKRKDDEKDD